ncbi:phosphate acyltransferase PlsX [Stutzerimonas frequens]|uniref:phosphate acyltransferase PlsX n=1 Tax=Stutzerimonas frequens TaxID=2968969 RepID=UPI002DBBB8B6|nr:phosphate acyltransferase PlsX [Stutzerimonas frequens]WRW25695.1 phosphate acyltransferase PlsX [Stutzerimonas frequens]
MSAPVIAIDAMGGDFGPHCIVPASLSCLAENSSLHLVLVGQSSLLEQLVAKHSGVDHSRLKIVDAPEMVAMDERPAQALRGKPRSSMRLALEQVRDGNAQACVSAGNTGALMALARQVLKTLPGIDRPAMVTALPTQGAPCLLLDLGANVDCPAAQLYQFAIMGAVAAESLGTKQPRVALLNVGTEEIKGNQQVKLATALLQQASGLNYRGFIEGDGLYRGEADVVVCDGFVGNVLLKSSEGLAGMLVAKVEALFRRSVAARIVGAAALPLLRRLRAELNPAQYNGASFLGLQGIVVKSHGSAGADGFKAAIRRATQDVEHDLPEQLRSRLGQFLSGDRLSSGADDVTAGDGWPSN